MEIPTDQLSSDRRTLGPAPGVGTPHLSASASQTLEVLREQRRSVDLAALSGLAGLHPNTVREHLDALTASGLVRRRRAAAQGRGRPAWLYEAKAVLPAGAEYTGLAVALASVVQRTSAHPRRDAELAGESWGRALARQRGVRAGLSPEQAREVAVELLDDLGFTPQRDAEDPAVVRLTRCPLLDAARENPRVVCSVHLGMLRGVLAEHGSDPTGSALVPFAEPGACVVVVPPVATDAVSPPARRPS